MYLAIVAIGRYDEGTIKEGNRDVDGGV